MRELINARSSRNESEVKFVLEAGYHCSLDEVNERMLRKKILK